MEGEIELLGYYPDRKRGYNVDFFPLKNSTVIEKEGFLFHHPFEIIETKAIDISESKLNEELGSGYGIFSGKDIKWATLRFTPERARWTASEKWHPKQIGKFLDDSV